MMNFEYFTPTKVVFGKGTVDKVGELVKAQGGTKVLIHYGGGSVKRTGLLDRVKAALDAAGVAHVDEIIDRGAAGVHFDLARFDGDEFFLLLGHGVV